MSKRHDILTLGLAFGLVFAGSTSTLWAQSTFGTLLGTVKDTSGAVVPNASVVITNTGEGSSRNVTTDVNGNYEVVDAKPGHYTVSVSKPGFETAQVTGLVLTARQVLRADVSLPLGKITQSVTVQGGAMGVISTDTSTVSSSFGHSQITDLPTNYRASANGNSPYYLLTVLPGITPDQNGNLSIQGGLQSQSAFTLDGISTTDYTGNGPITEAFPSAESIEEMRAQGVGAPAEYGDPADVTTTSKSGTNTLHGSVFEYDQNGAFNANPFGAISTPKLIANDFGGSLGGPVVLPHIYNGRDKTFFYADFEGFRSPRTGVVQGTVPTEAMRDGNMSYLCTAGFTGGVCNDASDQIYNTNGQPFVNDQIPSSMISPFAQKFLTLYPLPNIENTFTDDNYTVNRPANLDSNTFDVRVDQYFGSKLSVFGRYTYKNINELSPQELLFPPSTNYQHVRMLVLSATDTLKPTLLNEFRFGFTNHPTGVSNPFGGTAFASSLQSLGFQGMTNLWWNGVPEIDFSGATTSEDVDRLNSVSQSRNFEFLDDLSWIRGGHTFKFGGDAILISALTPLSFLGADNYTTSSFTGVFTGSDFADFLLGLPAETDLDDVNNDNDGRSHDAALYAQDSFRVTHRLTLDYGLRWEYDPGYVDAHGNIGNFDNHVLPGSGEAVYPNGYASNLAPPFLQSFDACPTPGVPATASDPASMNGAACTPVITASQAGLPQGLRDTSERFLPRFGFAYMPFHNDNTVVRGSIGSYEAQTLGSVFYSLTGTLQAYTRTYENSLTPTGPAFAWPDMSTGGSGFAAPEYGTAYFGTANQVDWKQPYSVQYSMSVEHNLGLATGLRLSYIGMKTTQLVWAPDWNQSLPSTIPFTSQPLSSRPYPNWGRIESRDVGATANYNSLEVEANHRLGSGLSLESTYIYDRNLADNQGPSSNGGFCGETACNRSGDYYDRELEYGNTYDPRHRWLTTLIYQLPVGEGRHFAAGSSRVVNALIGGWQASNIIEIQSGPWLTPYFTGGDPSGTGIGTYGGRNSSPDHIGPAYPGSQSASQYFLASGFICPGGNCLAGTSTTNPPIGRFGDAGIGTLEGPGTIDWDFGLAKSFQLSEHARLRFEVSFVNVLNHVNLGQPDMKITDANNPAQGECGFGCITAAQGLYEFAGAREGQIGARIDF